MNNTKVKTENKITIEEIVKLKECGLTYRDIASICGVSKQWIHYIVKRNMSRNQILTLKKDAVCLLKKKKFEDKISIEEYALRLGLSTYMTRRILAEGYNKIRKYNLFKVAKYLKCNPEELIEKETNVYRFLPNGAKDCSDAYKVVAYNIIKNNIGNMSKGKNIDGHINISQKTIDIIKYYRITKGYSLSEFSNMTGVSIGRISQLENGYSFRIKQSSLKKIANVLNINPEQLLVGEVDMDVDVEILDYKVKIDKNISKKIKKHRLSLKISQSELGRICGGNQALISRIELGAVKTIKKSMLKSIYKELGINFEDINNSK